MDNNSEAISDTDRVEQTTKAADEVGEALIRFEKEGAAARVRLNRPKSLNALNDEMRAQFPDHLKAWAPDPEIYAMIISSDSERAFCVGGDVRELHAAGQAGTALKSLQAEYQLNWLLDRFTKPTISLISGMVMGSGVGISQFGTHRVAGENYSFAMPEVAIGFFPDVGASWFLSRLDDYVGTYLGLTGSRIGRADAYALGLVTHCAPADQFSKIIDGIANADPVDPMLDALHEDPGAGELDELRATIRRCFSAATMEEIILRLKAVKGPHEKWRDQTLATIAKASPISLKVTLRQLRTGRRLDLRAALKLEYRLAAEFMAGDDFYEGVRAMLIDKDHAPNWQYKELIEISDDIVDGYFRDAQEHDLVLKAPSDTDIANS